LIPNDTISIYLYAVNFSKWMSIHI